MPSNQPRPKIRRRFFLCLLVFLFSVSAAAETLSPAAVAARVRPAFAFVAGGSGAVISEQGEIVTNNHVVEKMAKIPVTLGDGRTFTAQVVGRDRQGDLALLQIVGGGGPFPFLPLGDSAALRRGEPCYAAGNPLALGDADITVAFSAGVISALHQFRHGYNDAIVTDAAVNPGNSGGPLVNVRGELIGICGMTQTRLGLKSNTGVAFAIPVNQLKLWLPFLRRARGGNVFHGRLSGLELQEDSGIVKVKNVIPGSSGAAAGFRTGDVITAFMDYHVSTIARFDSISGIYPAGSSLQAVVRREGHNDGQTGTAAPAKVTLRFSLPPLRPWRAAFTLAWPRADEEFPRIETVIPNSAAAQSGVKANDEILAINNLPVRVGGLTQLTDYLANLHAGDKIGLLLRRGGEKIRAEFIAE